MKSPDPGISITVRCAYKQDYEKPYCAFGFQTRIIETVGMAISEPETLCAVGLSALSFEDAEEDMIKKIRAIREKGVGWTPFVPESKRIIIGQDRTRNADD